MRWSVLALLTVVACGGDSPPQVGDRTVAPVDTTEVGAAIDPAAYRAMVEVLRGETAPERRVWLVVAPGRPAADALARSLEAAFAEAGWTAVRQPLTGMTLKAGPVRLLAAEEEEPPLLDTVRRALAAAGVESQTGLGYRSFYEERKRENPAWVGVPMAPHQPFLVVVSGRAADS